MLANSGENMAREYACICGKKMKETGMEFEGFLVRGWKCSCGEELIDPLAVEKIREMKNSLLVKVREVGKSVVVTIPSILKEMAGLREGEKVAWRIEKGELVLGKNLMKKTLVG
jgi:hypothetical protein